MNKLLMTLLLGVCAFAQNGPPRIVELKYLNANTLPMFLGHAFQVTFSSIEGSRKVIITGQKENVDAAIEALKQMDVPRKNIDFSFQVLDAVPQPGEEKIPPDLEGVVKQLRSGFVYKAFRLVDTLQLRTQEGISGSVTGAVPRTNGASPLRFLQVDFRATSITGETKERTVHLEHLTFHSKLPNGGDGKGGINYAQTGIETSIDIPDGKKVVVGKANMDGEGGAYFLIVTAKVVD
jgi:hypothetical protein